jgi:hypothetical protein
MIDRLLGTADQLPVEAESRLIDIQGQTRRTMLKLRDSRLEHVLLVVSDNAQEPRGARRCSLEPISRLSGRAAAGDGRARDGSSPRRLGDRPPVIEHGTFEPTGEPALVLRFDRPTFETSTNDPGSGQIRRFIRPVEHRAFDGPAESRARPKARGPAP